nr:hypothetical protein [uncultured Lichenicoccus sp.]
MTEETIIAVYDSAEHAEAAIRDLTAAGVPAEAISHHAGNDPRRRGGGCPARAGFLDPAVRRRDRPC